MQSPLALSNLRVIELGQLIAGPFAAKTLADFGADVIKIEPPNSGDPLRKWRLLKDGTSVWWQIQSRNKRSVALDLKQACFKSRATERLLRDWICHHTDVPSLSKRHLRKGSPELGGSILITSAPKSAKVLAAKGPAINCPSSMTRKLESANGDCIGLSLSMPSGCNSA